MGTGAGDARPIRPGLADRLVCEYVRAPVRPVACPPGPVDWGLGRLGHQDLDWVTVSYASQSARQSARWPARPVRWTGDWGGDGSANPAGIGRPSRVQGSPRAAPHRAEPRSRQILVVAPWQSWHIHAVDRGHRGSPDIYDVVPIAAASSLADGRRPCRPRSVDDQHSPEDVRVRVTRMSRT